MVDCARAAALHLRLLLRLRSWCCCMADLLELWQLWLQAVLHC